MTDLAAEPPRRCLACGDALFSGPLGPQCVRCSFALSAAPEEDEEARVAELFPELRLEGRLARGGFGTVFRAEHRRMKRPVALKFLDTLLARSPESVALFEREMVTVGALDHPAIVRAYDAGERDGHWFIIMELVDGLDCGALARKHGRLPLAEACELIRQAALALAYAHGRGLVHRDVKPGNLMLAAGPAGTVKVLDFGLAGLAVAPVFGGPSPAGGETDHFFGTLEYTAPEQIETPGSVDARADVFGLGATLWRLLAGRTPRTSDGGERSLFRQMQRLVAEPVPPLATVRPDLPREFTRLCDRMLALKRDARPASAAEVAKLLEPWCAGAELPRLFGEGPLPERPFVFPKRRRRAAWAVAIGLGLATLGSVLFPTGRQAAPPSAPPAVAARNWQPVFSQPFARERHVDESSLPRLFASDWEHESQVIDLRQKVCGRLTPDGDLITIDPGFASTLQLLKNGRYADAVKIEQMEKVRALGVAPSGHLVWAQHEADTSLHIGRARPDGTPLPFLRYDYAAEFPPGVFQQKQQDRLKLDKPVRDGEPFGFAFVTADNLPADTGLQVGDVLVADLGHRTLGTGPSAVDTDPGVWRFRLDADSPARRLARLSQESWPIDVAVTRRGVFVLDRIRWNVAEVRDDDPRHLTDHLWRWDQDGWHKCTFDRPIVDVSGLAADPLSDDLYVVQGAAYPTVNPARQSVHRLRRTGPDRYAVEVFADHFGKLSFGGIAFSNDGRRMIITDSGNYAAVILKRK